MLGVPKAERGARTDETIEILQLAWRGEPFSYTGGHFQFDDVVVTPPPVQRPGPPIWVGGSSLAAARRRRPPRGRVHARLRGRAGRVRGLPRGLPAGSALPVATNRVLFAAESKEKAWELCGEHLLYQFNMYRRVVLRRRRRRRARRRADRPGGLRPSSYFVGTPDDILAAIRESQQRLGYEELVFWARPPGMPIEHSTASLELIARHVLPALRATAPHE